MLNMMLLASKNSRPRKGATRKAPPPPPKRSVPWWMWLAVPVLVLGFIFILFQLSDIDSTQPTKIVAPKPTPVEPKAAAKPTPKAPEKQGDKFEFYQLLQDSEVDTSHVDAYEYQPREEEDFNYMIQAASFRSSSDADRLRAKLILSGLDASIKASTSEDRGTWYRVIVGPFETRSGESRAQDKLAEMGMNSYTYKVKKAE